MYYHELINNIRRGLISPVYLFWGEETYLLREALTLLQTTITTGDTADFNYQVLRAGETSVAEIVSLANTLPVLAKHRLLVVQDAPWFKTKTGGGKKEPADGEAASKSSRGEDEVLLSYLNSPCETTCLVFWADGQVNSQKKLTRTILKQGATVEFAPLKGAALANWIKQKAGLEGKNITTEALAYLGRSTGANLSQLHQELEKLILYLGMETTITLETVRLLTPRTQEASIFELVDALGEKKRNAALALLNEMFTAGKPPLLLAYMITRQIRLIFQAKLLLTEGAAEQELTSCLKIPPFVARKIKKQAGAFELAELEKIMQRLLELDLQLKNSSLEPKYLLEMLLWSLAG